MLFPFLDTEGLFIDGLPINRFSADSIGEIQTGNFDYNRHKNYTGLQLQSDRIATKII